jgi:hypothetical protein
MGREIERSDDLPSSYRTEERHGNRESTLRSVAGRKGDRTHDGIPFVREPGERCQSLHRLLTHVKATSESRAARL